MPLFGLDTLQPNQYGTHANRPAAGAVPTGFLYFETDTLNLFESDGVATWSLAVANAPPSGPAGGSLSGTYPNPTIAVGAVTSAMIADGTIVAGDINAAAGIAKTQLAALGIVNADVAAGAAIAQSKLTLAITNAEVAAGAAIAQSKLTLAITNAEVAAGAAIAQSKLTLAITNAEVAAGAAIVKSKLAALAIVDADVSAISDTKITLTGTIAPLASPTFTGIVTTAQLVTNFNTNALANIGSPANYAQMLWLAGTTNGTGPGLGFSTTSTNISVGAAIIFNRIGAGSQGALQFYTKQSTSAGVAPVLCLTMTEAGHLSIPDASNLVFGTATGTMIGTATNQKVGAWGKTPVVQQAAFTQTYATASHTQSTPVGVAVATTAPVQVTPWGYASSAQALDIITELNALITDHANTKQVLNGVIDDLQAIGWLA